MSATSTVESVDTPWPEVEPRLFHETRPPPHQHAADRGAARMPDIDDPPRPIMLHERVDRPRATDTRKNIATDEATMRLGMSQKSTVLHALLFSRWRRGYQSIGWVLERAAVSKKTVTTLSRLMSL